MCSSDLTEYADKLMRGLVAARRVNRVLSLRAEIADPAEPVALPERGDLVDHESGLVARHGVFTAVVADEPDRAAVLADKLGRYADGRVTFGGVALAAATRDDVRERILVSDTGAQLFTGVLREELDPDGGRGDDELMAAIRTASAEDVLVALPDGLDADVEEKGRSFSGGEIGRASCRERV